MPIESYPRYHTIKPEELRRIERNSQPSRRESLMLAGEEYEAVLAQLPEAERLRHEERVDAYVETVRDIIWLDRKSVFKPEVVVVPSMEPRMIFRKLLVPGERFLKPDVEICISDPANISTQEEFMHAVECGCRDVISSYAPTWRRTMMDGMDPVLTELVSGMTHFACLIDMALTLAAHKKNRLTELRSMAWKVTKRDAESPTTRQGRQDLMGTCLNERFQYDPVPLSILSEMIQTCGEDLDVYLNGVDQNGKTIFRPEMGEALTLFSLAYGEKFLWVLFDLLDVADASEAVEKASRWIDFYTADDGEGLNNLVRHQIPLGRDVETSDLPFEVNETFNILEVTKPVEINLDGRIAHRPNIFRRNDFLMEALNRRPRKRNKVITRFYR